MSMPPYDPQTYGLVKPKGVPRRRLWIIAGVLGVFAMCFGGIAAGSIAADSEPGLTVGEAAGSAAVKIAPSLAPASKGPRPPAPEAEPVAKAPEPVTLTEGTWSVPDEAKPGTYTTNADGHCYWARLSNFEGDLGSIKANENLSSGERGRITIKKSDAGIELSGSCVWTLKK